MNKKPSTDYVSLAVKVNFLVLGLFLIGYAIYSLKSGTPKWMASLFGTSEASKVTLCQTRVTGILKPDAYRIGQKGRSWIKETASSQSELDFLSVERWFGANCAIQAEVLGRIETQANARPLLFLQFVTEKVEPLLINPDGSFIWQNKWFKSEELNKAINALESIPERPIK